MLIFRLLALASDIPVLAPRFSALLAAMLVPEPRLSTPLSMSILPIFVLETGLSAPLSQSAIPVPIPRLSTFASAFASTISMLGLGLFLPFFFI